MNYENLDLLYIEPTSEEIVNFKKIIKKQGEFTCKNEFDTVTISESVNSFTFGYVSILPKAQTGRRSLKDFNDKFMLKAFILCMYNKLIPEEIYIQLLCSINKTGKLLMEVVENLAKERSIKRLTLDCLANEKLKKWYESMGFKYVRTIYLSKDIPKVYYMVKII